MSAATLATGAWWRPFRHVDDVAVYHVDLAPNEDHEAQAWGWLDDKERSRCREFGHPGPRRRFVLCRAALRAELGRHLEVANDRLGFAAGEHGKPLATVDGSAAFASFNVSHSGLHGLFAVAPFGRVGVDVADRAPRRNLDGLIRATTSPDEQADFEGCDRSDREHRFFRLWTLKEALTKADGAGISSVGLANVEIPEALRRGATGGIAQFPPCRPSRWHLHDLGTDDFAAALAHEAK